MNRVITPLALLAALIVTAFAAPAFAQANGGIEGRQFALIADPAGADIHFGTVWFAGGESIWLAKNKVDLADLDKGVELVDEGDQTIPTTLFTSFSSTTLSSTTSYGYAHIFERASDNAMDFMLQFKLETSCSVDCLLTGVTFLMVDDMETDLENPSYSVYEMPLEANVTGLAGDYIEFHNPH